MSRENLAALAVADDAALLLARARAELDTGGLSQARAAKEAGISDAAFSQWLSGTYRGNAATIAGKVERWLETRHERRLSASRMPALPAFAETATAARILNALSYVQSAADLGVIYGASGVGKTVAAREYARQHSNVWLVTVTPASAALGAFLARVAAASGVRLSSRRCADMEDSIVRRLRESGGLLVVDEAQHLKTRVIEQARAIYDATGVGLVLMGNELVYSQLHGSVRAAAFAQLFSRVGKRLHLTGASRGDAATLLRKFGACADGEEKRFLSEIARQPGALRAMLQVARLGCVLAGSKRADRRHLERAYLNLKKAA